MTDTGAETGEKTINDTILDATLRILAQNKVSGTRMHLIAAEAGTSQSNLHYHYPTKNDLLLAAFHRIQDYFAKKRTASVDFSLTRQTPRENLRGLFEEKRDDILNHPEVDCIQFDYWVQGTVDPAVRAEFCRSFAVWRRDIERVFASIRPDCPQKTANALSHLMVSMMLGASLQYLVDEDSFSLDNYFETAERMVLAMLESAANPAREKKESGDGARA